jgi:ABC-type uncharacterized transport system ATPase subunit
MTDTLALELRGISRRFGANLALDDVNFTLKSGEIHALLGENGAGKSTLMHIVRGLLAPDDGQIILQGQPVVFASPRDATRAGIGMVHQHFLLVPPFTVAENLALVADEHGVLLDTRKVMRRASETMSRLGWQIPLNTRVADLPVGTQQRVEILKALLGDAQILLFDEPTAVLAPNEISELFHVLQVLRDEGRSLVFVSHKLGEVMALCDRVTVLRRGCNVGMVEIAETSPEDLAQRMVGDSHPVSNSDVGAWHAMPRPNVMPRPLLSVAQLTTASQSNAVALHDITFALASGEILGFAGVDGNGQAELAQALTGLRPWTGGTVTLKDKILKRLRPQDLVRLGIALIPPDRHREGLALSLSVAENLTLEAAGLPRFRRGPFLNRASLRRFAVQTAQDYDIRAENLDMPTSSLSGGNQQKIVIARALWRKPMLLVAVSPTRGLDVAATAYVHTRLRERQSEGGTILLISTELDEVIALSTRIAVLYEGHIVGIVSPQTPRETLGLMMGGRQAIEA